MSLSLQSISSASLSSSSSSSSSPTPVPLKRQKRQYKHILKNNMFGEGAYLSQQMETIKGRINIIANNLNTELAKDFSVPDALLTRLNMLDDLTNVSKQILSLISDISTGILRQRIINDILSNVTQNTNITD
jgi:hypothetical protein